MVLCSQSMDREDWKSREDIYLGDLDLEVENSLGVMESGGLRRMY